MGIFDFLKSNPEKPVCDRKLFACSQLVIEIKSKEEKLSDNKKMIQKKWELHNSYYPRLWDSYRTEIQKDIDGLNKENSAIEKDLTELHSKKSKLLDEIDKCIEQGNVPVNLTIEKSAAPKM